jgi:hypothetical protein
VLVRTDGPKYPTSPDPICYIFRIVNFTFSTQLPEDTLYIYDMIVLQTLAASTDVEPFSWTERPQT